MLFGREGPTFWGPCDFHVSGIRVLLKLMERDLCQTARTETREILTQNGTRIHKKRKSWRIEIRVISGGCVKENHFVGRFTSLACSSFW